MHSTVKRKIITSVVAIGGGVVALAAHAATDYCALVKPEEISKAFGENFNPPTRQSTPTGPLAGPSTTCTYKGTTLELTIASIEALTVAKNLQNYEIRHARELSKNHAVDLTGVGDNAFCTHTKVDSRQGSHDYTFWVLPSGASPSSFRKDWKEPLVNIAKLFYSRLN